MKINPLSAIWRIYPSSKWSSQWPYDGYIRHGWLTGSRRGRDSATPECFGRGSQGTIFVRSSKISLFFPELCSFRRVFVSRAFVRFGAKRSSAGAFGFDDVLELFLETPLGHRASFLRTPTTTSNIFLKISFLFSKHSRCYLPDSYGDPQVEQSILVMIRQKLAGKLHFRSLARSAKTNQRSSSWLVRVTCGDRWSKREKKTQGSQRVIVRSLNPSSSTNQRVVWKSLFPRPNIATVLHFAVFMYVDVQLQVGQAAARGQRRKAVIRDISGVDHRRVTNLSASIWFTGERYCTVFRHVMQLSLLVLC